MKKIFLVSMSCLLFAACTQQPVMQGNSTDSNALISPSTIYTSEKLNISFLKPNESFNITELSSSNYAFNSDNASLRLGSVNGIITIIRYQNTESVVIQDKFKEYSKNMIQKAVAYIQDDWIPVLKSQGRDTANALNSIKKLQAFNKSAEATFTPFELENIKGKKAQIVSDFHEAYTDNFETSDVYIIEVDDDVVAVVTSQNSNTEAQALISSLKFQ